MTVLKLIGNCTIDGSCYGAPAIDRKTMETLTEGRGLETLTWTSLDSLESMPTVADAGISSLFESSPKLIKVKITIPGIYLSRQVIDALATCCRSLTDIKVCSRRMNYSDWTHAVPNWKFLKRLEITALWMEIAPGGIDRQHDYNDAEGLFAAIANGCPQLTSLGFYSGAIPPLHEERPWTQFQRLLKQLVRLELDSSYGSIGATALDAMAMASESLTSLVLRLEIPPDVSESLVDVLVRNFQRLQDLRLYTHVSPESFTRLIRFCPALVTLMISNPAPASINDTHAFALADGGQPVMLKELCINSRCQFTDAGFRALANGCLRNLTCLRITYVYDTREVDYRAVDLSVDGVRALVNECPNLCEFEMHFAGRLEGDTTAFIADMRLRGISTILH